MTSLCETHRLKEMELENLRQKGHQERSNHHAQLRKMNLNLTVARKAQISDRPLHEYTSALDLVQSPAPPSYVLQKQALLCRALHSLEVKSKAVNLANQKCSDIIRRVRKSIQNLHNERANMEMLLLKEMVILDDDLRHLKQHYSSILKKQAEELKALRRVLNPSKEEDGSAKGGIKQPTYFKDSHRASFRNVSGFSLNKNENVIALQCDPATHLIIEQSFPQQKRHNPPVA
mmetsp:Transcript_4220/g.6053  ORF Transcript_4220/g.6053 Transcript_4220/m.6053 type:complete len:232 (+) Transcript_4220:99-794(+)